MSKICYVKKKFGKSAQMMIDRINTIVTDYGEQGFTLTLRQIFYQCVAHDLFPDDRRWRQVPGTNKWVRDPGGTINAEPNYKWLGCIVNDARMAGLIDWEAIEDRGRVLRRTTTWDNPANIIEACAKQYRVDMWENQPRHIEVWVEKDALIGVIAPACEKLRVNHFACRGYVSQSAMWEAGATRLSQAMQDDKEVIILHLGDHDPSGLDMTRDIETRLCMFCGDADLVMKRLALNMDQVKKYSPPPNPAKTTDARFGTYLAQYGDESWELDALDPKVIDQLISDTIMQLIDKKRWAIDAKREDQERSQLVMLSDNWDDVVERLEKDGE